MKNRIDLEFKLFDYFYFFCFLRYDEAMKEEIQKILTEAVKALQKAKAWPDFTLEEIQVDYPSEEKFGDYASNIAMLLAKKVGKKPLEIAETLKTTLKTEFDSDLESNSVKLSLEKIEAAAPGYLNFYLKQLFFSRSDGHLPLW